MVTDSGRSLRMALLLPVGAAAFVHLCGDADDDRCGGGYRAGSAFIDSASDKVKTDDTEAAPDTNGEGKVNNRDATRLLQYLSDWDVELY